MKKDKSTKKRNKRGWSIQTINLKDRLRIQRNKHRTRIIDGSESKVARIWRCKENNKFE